MESFENFSGPKSQLSNYNPLGLGLADLLTSLKKEKPRGLHSSEPRRCEDIKGIVAPEMSQKTFCSFEKEAPGVHVCLSIRTDYELCACMHTCTK